MHGICETIKGADVVRLINEVDRRDKLEIAGRKFAMARLRATLGLCKGVFYREFRV